ncbi:plastocyanin [Acidovorax lacteus]|uniref:Plastocyanin n=1 Tax=Acidovorax lacteus TaxID=1924988 RepID=A0ABP8LEF2_9BURK
MLDRDGRPVQDAVVVVYPTGAAPAPAALLPAAPVIEQERMRFVPQVTVVAPGTTVRFTNLDRWDHHVRGTSASAPGAPELAGFELRLAGKVDGRASDQAEVRFDQAGVLLLGCHLHGSMRGHVFVTDSAWTVKTDADGIARLSGVPDGPAQLRVWQADQLVDLPRRAVQVSATPVLESVQLSVVPRRRR